MWITKLKLKHNDCPIVNRCEKFNVIVLSYPVSWYEKNGDRYSTTVCSFQAGDKEKRKSFLRDLKNDSRITNLEVSDNIFTYEINLGKKGEHVMLYYNQALFFVKPVVNHYDGYEYWEVASWKKELLQEFIKRLETHMDVFSLLKIEQSSLKDIYFPNIMPELSKGQKEALELAYTRGYYNYPKKTSLKKLSKEVGLSLSTLQEHLRKAEIKLLPAIIEREIKSKRY